CAPYADCHLYRAVTFRGAEDGIRRRRTHPTVRRHTFSCPPYPERGFDPVEGERILARATTRYQVAGEEKSLADDRIVVRLGTRGIDLAGLDVDGRRGLWKTAELAWAKVVDGGDVGVPELGLQQRR